jgi:hypothetical protein
MTEPKVQGTLDSKARLKEKRKGDKKKGKRSKKKNRSNVVDLGYGVRNTQIPFQTKATCSLENPLNLSKRKKISTVMGNCRRVLWKETQKGR